MSTIPPHLGRDRRKRYAADRCGRYRPSDSPEKRWSSFQILIEVAIVGMVLIGIAAIRAHGEFDGNVALVCGWRLGLAVGLLLLITLRIAMARPGRGRASA